MAVFFSLQRFPLNADVKDQCGLPWGCAIQPFASIANGGAGGARSAADAASQQRHIPIPLDAAGENMVFNNSSNNRYGRPASSRSSTGAAAAAAATTVSRKKRAQAQAQAKRRTEDSASDDSDDYDDDDDTDDSYLGDEEEISKVKAEFDEEAEREELERSRRERVIEEVEEEILDSGPVAVVDQVSRCGNCFGYINPHCKFSSNRTTWFCSLCKHQNKSAKRYLPSDARLTCPELNSNVLELEVPNYSNDLLSTLPAYIFVVDITGPPEYLDNLTMSLNAALEALPNSSLIALVSYSDRLGVYDLRSSEKSHVKYILIPPGSPLPLSLQEVFSMEEFFVEVGRYRENIALAIDSLLNQANNTQNQTAAAEKSNNNLNVISIRGFGTALSSLLEYVASLPESVTLHCQIISVICNRPNYGLGNLKEFSSEQETQMGPKIPFYSELGHGFADLGICVDTYAVCPNHAHFELASIYPVSQLTGGHVYYYDMNTAVYLPQDLHKHLSQPHAFQCLLRIRTASSFRVARSYGHLTEDTTHEGVFKIASCDPLDTYGFDFEFDSTTSFDDYILASTGMGLPTIQMVFAYTTLYQRDSVTPPRLQRRLRLITNAIQVESMATEVISHAKPAVIMYMLVQKVIRACNESGIQEGLLLLQDWLTVFLARYQENNARNKFDSPHELSFRSLGLPPHLEKLVKYVFAFMKHPLMHENLLSDRRVFLQSLLNHVNPFVSSLMIYPKLYGFESFDSLPHLLPLTRTHMSSKKYSIYVLDSLLSIVVCLVDPSLPLRPPDTSNLKIFLNQLKLDRPILPQPSFVRDGSPEAANLFDPFLLEDRNPMASQDPRLFGSSLETYIDSLCADIMKEMKISH